MDAAKNEQDSLLKRRHRDRNIDEANKREDRKLNLVLSQTEKNRQRKEAELISEQKLVFKRYLFPVSDSRILNRRLALQSFGGSHPSLSACDKTPVNGLDNHRLGGSRLSIDRCSTDSDTSDLPPFRSRSRTYSGSYQRPRTSSVRDRGSPSPVKSSVAHWLKYRTMSGLNDSLPDIRPNSPLVADNNHTMSPTLRPRSITVSNLPFQKSDDTEKESPRHSVSRSVSEADCQPYDPAILAKKESGRSRSVAFTSSIESDLNKKKLQRTPTPYWPRRELLQESTIYGEDCYRQVDHDGQLSRSPSQSEGGKDSRSSSAPASPQSSPHVLRREQTDQQNTSNASFTSSPLLRKVISARLQHGSRQHSSDTGLSEDTGCDAQLLHNLTEALPQDLYDQVTEEAKRLAGEQGMCEQLRRAMLQESKIQATSDVLADPRWQALEASLTKLE